MHEKKRKAGGCERCKFNNDYAKLLKDKCKRLELENYDLNEEKVKLKAKLKVRKEKYRNLKTQLINSGNSVASNLKNIGVSTLTDKEKFNMCRISNVSKYISDLLDIVFGRDVLAKSSIKGVKGSTKLPLPENILNDDLVHISHKFSIDVSVVRSAVRQKLNVCRKANLKFNEQESLIFNSYFFELMI